MYDHYTEDYRTEANNSFPDNEDFMSNLDRGNVIFAAFGFERFIYLNVWVALVILTALVNTLVMWVLLQKKMRSVTNILLVAIAMSDSMMGLVKLPTFIMVYGKVDSRTPLQSYSSYNMSKMLCSAFMISKHFLSQSFHTISIWLTLFLGIQRYISVAYPFKTRLWFTARKTAIVVVLICVFAPVLHLYHLVHEHEKTNGFCTWILFDESLAQVWITLFLRHLIPCFVLAITTVLFIRNLNKNLFQPTNSEHSSSNEDRRRENRRMSKIVVAIVILFLITEIPYGLYLLLSSIIVHLNMRPLFDKKEFSAISVVYELTFVLSYHFNFYIYTFFNKRFRSHLRKTFGTFASRLNKLFRSTRASSSGDERNIQGTTENMGLPDAQEGKRLGNRVAESVV